MTQILVLKMDQPSSRHDFRKTLMSFRTLTNFKRGPRTHVLLANSYVNRPHTSSANRMTPRSKMQQTQFTVDNNGFIARKATIDGNIQVLVPTALRKPLLYHAHYPVLLGNPGRRRIYASICRIVISHTRRATSTIT